MNQAFPDDTPEPRSTNADTPSDPEVAKGGALLDSDDVDALPTSFGVFKPVGHVMMGLPTQAQADALVDALLGAGWPGPDVRQFTPRESVDDMQELIDNAGALAELGYEITMLRRYKALAEKGYRWLLVKADDNDRAVAAAELARASGATLAVHYRMLTVEDLIT